MASVGAGKLCDPPQEAKAEQHTMYFFGRVIYGKVASHDERALCNDVEGVFKRLAVLVQDDGIAKLKDGPVIRGQGLGHRLDDG